VGLWTWANLYNRTMLANWMLVIGIRTFRVANLDRRGKAEVVHSELLVIYLLSFFVSHTAIEVWIPSAWNTSDARLVVHSE
jgi:hypothetical protein